MLAALIATHQLTRAAPVAAQRWQSSVARVAYSAARDDARDFQYGKDVPILF